VRTRPRRGIFVVRKTKREIVEMITVMAVLESMAARLAAERASACDIAELHRLMDAFRAPHGQEGGERLADYSDAHISFHQAIIKMIGCALLADMTENLFIHMRAIRKITIHQDDRAARSVVDHFRIIEALKRRDPELAEQLAREHTPRLAVHVGATRRFSRHNSGRSVRRSGNHDPK